MDNDKMIEKIAHKLPINEIYTDLLKPSFSHLGKTGEYILKFVALPFSFLGMTADELEKKYKLFIASALNKVPEEKRQKPSPLIAGPLLEYVKYIFDNEQEKLLENMFSELLGNASNKDFKDYVQPSYVYILQQLTWVEAELLRLIYEYQSDVDCLGVSFKRFNAIEDNAISVISDEAEPLIAFDDGEISNVFYEYFICVLTDNLMVSDTIFKKGLNILQQLNLIVAFDINKYRDNDKYSLEKHNKNHLNEFDPYKKIKAYTLTSYANDLMELCINPKDNMCIYFKCKNCGAIFQNLEKKDYCPSCQSKEVELLL